MHGRRTSRPKPSKPSPSHGHLPYGGSTWSGLCRRPPGGYTHILVAIDKFSKWIEARPINQIKSEQVVLFFTDITHKFRVPNTIITDNGTQFTGHKFLTFYDDHHIRVAWSAVGHPRTNGQVEVPTA